MGELCTISGDTKTTLEQFRLDSSRARNLQARICAIGRERQITVEGEVYDNLDDLADAVPNAQPRFIILSCPIHMSDGRVSYPYVMVYYIPEGCRPELGMAYASSRQMVSEEAGVNRIIDVTDEFGIMAIPEKLGGSLTR